VILAQGMVHSGWSLYVKNDKPKFAYNYLGNVTYCVCGAPACGSCDCCLRFRLGRWQARRRRHQCYFHQWKESGHRTNRKHDSIFFGIETAGVGEDLYAPVTSDYAMGNNKFTGTIDKVSAPKNPVTTGGSVPPDSNAFAAAGVPSTVVEQPH
jgi:hypothetical protein